MLLKRLFCPPSVVPGTPAETHCDTVTMKSVKLRLKVGRRWMIESETKLCVPVGERQTRRLASPVTVTASSPTAARLRDTLTSNRWPSVKLNGSLCFASKPSARVCYVYGPPNATFSKLYRPSSAERRE